MRQHPRIEEGLEDLSARGVFPVIPTASRHQSTFGEPLVVFAQPFSPGRVVWEEGKQQEGAEDGDDALDDEEPSEALEAACTVHMADSIGDGTAKSSCEVAERHDTGNANRALVKPVPDRDEIHNA